MILYRIARAAYATDLSGAGARIYGGRWNSVGKPMVYFASSRSLAVLEVLVHLTATIIPDDFQLVSIEMPDDVFEPDTSIFPTNWKSSPEPEILKRTGDFFLQQNKNLLMKVPSVIVEQEFNYLYNPIHKLAGSARLLHKEPFNFDHRLL